MPPWRLAGIDVLPASPENGLGFDFWSTRLFLEYPSDTGLLAGVLVVLLILEVAIVATGARIVSYLRGEARLWSGLSRIWLIASTSAFLLFDAIHFLL